MSNMNINEALGGVRRPLQVGNWVECVNGSECDELENASWPRQIKFIDDGAWVGFDSDQRGEWGMHRFRRVDPPTSDNVVAELRRQLADAMHEQDDVAELREQVGKLNDDIRQYGEAFAECRDAWDKERQEYADELTRLQGECDKTPATVEWLREIGLEAIDEGLCAFGMLQVLVEDDGSYAMLYDGQESMVFKDNPTRGDVLTAVRLFGGSKR